MATPPSVIELLGETREPPAYKNAREALQKRTDRDSMTWVDGHMEAYKNVHLRWGSVQPTASTEASPWYGALTQKEKSILVFDQAINPGHALRNIGGSLTAVARSSYMDDPIPGPIVSPPFVPSQRIWFEQAGLVASRVLLGFELLHLQGFPYFTTAFLDKHEDADLYEMGASSMSLHVALACAMACFAAPDWETPDGAPSSSLADVNGVLQTFVSISSTEHAGAPDASPSIGSKRRRLVRDA